MATINNNDKMEYLFFHQKKNADKRVFEMSVSRIEVLIAFLHFTQILERGCNNNLLQHLLDKIIELKKQPKYKISSYAVSFCDEQDC